MDFYRRMAVIGDHIPYGKVATYGQIALLCGKPDNSRQIGYALKRGKAGEDFPAHRVVSGQGNLSGAAAFATPTLQKSLLEKEGVWVNEEGKVDLKKFRWQHTMAEALAFNKIFESNNI